MGIRPGRAPVLRAAPGDGLAVIHLFQSPNIKNRTPKLGTGPVLRIAYVIEEEKPFRLREDGEPREAFEVQVRFNTSAKIEATFPKRAEAITFLRGIA